MSPYRVAPVVPVQYRRPWWARAWRRFVRWREVSRRGQLVRPRCWFCGRRFAPQRMRSPWLSRAVQCVDRWSCLRAHPVYIADLRARMFPTLGVPQ